MKAFIKYVILAFVFVLPAFAKASTCAEKKSFVIKEIAAAIETYPNSCRSSFNIKCRILFNSQLQKLIGVIERDEKENLNKIVDFIGSNRAMISDAIADDFQKQTNSLLGDLAAYNQQCAK